MDAFDELSPPYSTLVVDPPWPYPEGTPDWSTTGNGRHALPYSQMSLDEIAELAVGDLAGAGAHLYLWATNRYLEAAYRIVRGWGFIPTVTLTWCKEPIGLGPGGRYAVTTEFVIHAQLARRDRREVERAGSLIKGARETAGLSRADVHRLVRGGRMTGLVGLWEVDDCLPSPDDWRRLQEVLPALAGVPRPAVEPPPDRAFARVNTTWWQWKRGPHSAKPPAFLDVVEQVSPGPYVELFSRTPRLGWDSWGHGYEIGRAS